MMEHEEDAQQVQDVENHVLLTPSTSGMSATVDEDLNTTVPRSQQQANDAVDDSTTALHHVMTVLGFDKKSRKRMEKEGIIQLEHVYDLEGLLRQTRVTGLTSMETVKLVQFLDWCSYFQSLNKGCLPNVLVDFTPREYSRFTERQRAHTHVWPFLAQWEINDGDPSFTPPSHDDVEQTIPIREQDDARSGSARLYENFLLAEDAHRDFREGSGLKRDLKCAIDNYRLVVEETTVTIQDCMLQAFACVKLGVLLLRIEFKNNHQAMIVMERAAVQYKVPAGMFFYGYALVNGRGGVSKNVPRGIAMLNEAGASGILEAYFQLGNIYERGVGGVDMDFNLAREFYDATTDAIHSTRKQVDGWKQLLVEVSNVFTTHDYKMPMPEAQVATPWKAEITSIKGLLLSEGWINSEGVFLSVVGERFNWGLAGQAFLVGAAVVLTQTTQANHYPTLLPIVPFLGMLLAFFSIVQTLEVVWRNNSRRIPVRQMHSAKLRAFRHMLKVGAWHMIFIPPFHYLVLVVYILWYWLLRFCSCLIRTRNRFGFEKRSEKVDAKIVWLRTWGHTLMLAFITWLIEIMVLVVACAFLGAWLVLFGNELRSYQDGCSNWWYNTCQGSDVVCNEQEVLNQCPARFV